MIPKLLCGDLGEGEWTVFETEGWFVNAIQGKYISVYKLFEGTNEVMEYVEIYELSGLRKWTFEQCHGLSLNFGNLMQMIVLMDVLKETTIMSLSILKKECFIIALFQLLLMLKEDYMEKIESLCFENKKKLLEKVILHFKYSFEK